MKMLRNGILKQRACILEILFKMYLAKVFRLNKGSFRGFYRLNEIVESMQRIYNECQEYWEFSK